MLAILLILKQLCPSLISIPLSSVTTTTAFARHGHTLGGLPTTRPPLAITQSNNYFDWALGLISNLCQFSARTACIQALVANFFEPSPAATTDLDISNNPTPTNFSTIVNDSFPPTSPDIDFEIDPPSTGASAETTQVDIQQETNVEIKINIPTSPSRAFIPRGARSRVDDLERGQALYY